MTHAIIAFGRADKAQELHPMDPAGWGVKEWGVVGGILIAGLRLLWGKGIKPVWHWLQASTTLPVITKQIASDLAEIRDMMEQSAGRSRAILDTQPFPVWESNAHGDCVFANRAMLDVLRADFSGIEGRAWEARIFPADRQLVYDAWYQAVENKTDFELEYRWQDTHGKPIPIRVVCRRIFDRQNNVLGWLSNVTLEEPQP